MTRTRSSRWVTLVSTYVVGVRLVGSLPLEILGAARTALTVLSVLALAGAVLLWSHGIRDAGSGWRRLVFLAAFAGSIAVVITGFLRGLLEGVLEVPQATGAAALQKSLAELVSWVALTLVIGVVLHRLECHRSDAARQAAAAREAREQELRARLAPHFIFNALNTLHAQIDRDPAEAQATTERLAGLFRRVIDVSQRPTIPLAEELEFVESYLGIEKARLGARLGVRIQVPEELEAVEIPPLSLQVLVENAVKHGIAPLERGGTVVVGAERVDDGTTRLFVQDPGPGFSTERGSGTALEVLRQRLASPDDLTMRCAGGVHTVSFVWQHAPVSAPAAARA